MLRMALHNAIDVRIAGARQFGNLADCVGRASRQSRQETLNHRKRQQIVRDLFAAYDRFACQLIAALVLGDAGVARDLDELNIRKHA